MFLRRLLWPNRSSLDFGRLLRARAVRLDRLRLAQMLGDGLRHDIGRVVLQVQNAQDLVALDRFLFQQRFRQRVQRLSVVFQQLARFLIGDVNNALDLGIKFGGGVVAINRVRWRSRSRGRAVPNRRRS